MKSFVQYDRITNELISQDENKIPTFCLKCVSDPNKKCKKHYENIINNNIDGLFLCPYGFYTYFKKNTITTSLILRDKKNDKLIKTLKNNNKKMTDYDMYTENQFLNLMDDIDLLYTKNIELRDCMHDLRNMGGYFNSMSEIIELKHKELAENDEDVRAMLALYDLINYRLNVNSEIEGINNKRIKAKLYPLVKKLQVMMRYQAKKKKIEFIIDYEQENQVILSNNIYLVVFILMENAVKHSGENAKINIDFEEDENYTTFSISNIGPYINEDEKDKLYERGYRGKNAVSKGSGIGLSMVKQILEDYKYEYNLDIVNINKKECIYNFSIKFPCKKNS